MQVSYHSILTKIQKLQNKKKFFFFFWYRLVRLVFLLARNVGVLIPVYVPVQYIPHCTSMVSTTLVLHGRLVVKEVFYQVLPLFNLRV